MQPDLPPEIGHAAPGALGAIVALRWATGSWWQLALSVLGGATAAWYASDHLAPMLGLGPGLSGALAFLTGLFSMPLAGRVMEAIEALNIGRRINKLLDKWGL